MKALLLNIQWLQLTVVMFHEICCRNSGSRHTYMKLFDGSRLTPSIKPHCSDINLKVVGRILSHGYMCTGFLSADVALPALMATYYLALL